jgi:hypothetical protein
MAYNGFDENPKIPEGGCLMASSISVNTTIHTYFLGHDAFKNMPQKALRLIEAIISTMVIRGFSTKMIEISAISGYDRRTVSHFLSDGSWNEEAIKSFIHHESIRVVKEKAA